MSFEHRKATRRVKVVNAAGTAMANTKLTLRQTNHKFLFGCGAFDTLEIVNPKDAESRVFFEDRMEKFRELFNYGTLPFYLGRYEPVEGRPKEEETLAAAKWLKERGVTVKGHPLCWHTACADWLMDYPNEVVLEKQLQRIPFLSKIPLLGFLFKNHFKSKSKTEVIMLLTPYLSDAGTSPAIYEDGEAAFREAAGRY